MFARVTPFEMKPDHRDRAIALLKELKPQIMAMPGMRHFIHVMDDDGKGYVVSLVDSKELSDKNADKVRALWGRFSDHLVKQPTPGGYTVIAEWDKVDA